MTWHPHRAPVIATRATYPIIWIHFDEISAHDTSLISYINIYRFYLVRIMMRIENKQIIISNEKLVKYYWCSSHYSLNIFYIIMWVPLCFQSVLSSKRIFDKTAFCSYLIKYFQPSFCVFHNSTIALARTTLWHKASEVSESEYREISPNLENELVYLMKDTHDSIFNVFWGLSQSPVSLTPFPSESKPGNFFTHICLGYFNGNVTIIRLSQYHWINPDNVYLHI